MMNHANYLYMNRMGRGNPGAVSGGQSFGTPEPVFPKEMQDMGCGQPPAGIRPWMETEQREAKQPDSGWAERFPVGMGYVPMQNWQPTYSMEEGFRRGTIFPVLDLPFMMGRCI